jgi:hypothetical protein
LIRRFVDEYKPSSSYFPRIPGPQLQRASLVVRASGGFGRATTESSTKFMKSSFLFLSFARATVERSTSAEFVLGCCCLCRVILERDSVPQRWKSRGRFLSQDTCIRSILFIVN